MMLMNATQANMAVVQTLIAQISAAHMHASVSVASLVMEEFAKILTNVHLIQHVIHKHCAQTQTARLTAFARWVTLAGVITVRNCPNVVPTRTRVVHMLSVSTLQPRLSAIV